jgi:hypothetical protein
MGLIRISAAPRSNPASALITDTSRRRSSATRTSRPIPSTPRIQSETGFGHAGRGNPYQTVESWRTPPNAIERPDSPPTDRSHNLKETLMRLETRQ